MKGVFRIERHAALRALSQDHHHGLVQARRLSQADASRSPEDLKRTVEAFLSFWRAEGHRHFQEEESILLPVYARRGDPKEGYIVEMLAQHAEIRRDALDVELDLSQARPVDVDRLNALGRRLREHIRFEEREVFPMVEKALTDEDLRFVQQRLEHD